MFHDHTDFCYLVLGFCTKWDFVCLRDLGLALVVLSFGAVTRTSLDFLLFGALEIFGFWESGGCSPGQLLKT